MSLAAPTRGVIVDDQRPSSDDHPDVRSCGVAAGPTRPATLADDPISFFPAGGLDPMFSPMHMFAYFSPETMVPLSSLIATIAGFALLIKRSSVRFLVECCRAAIGRARRALRPRE
jgi:hypothetical protein